MRLNRFLAVAGIASRRAGDSLILAGRVCVNGRVADALGTKIDPDVDQVAVDGRLIRPAQERVYCLFNKPTGCLSTVTDPHGRRTVMEYVKNVPQRIFPVGRLDYDTEGILLFTNDGELSHALIHPRFGVDKEYEVLVRGQPTDDALQRLESGIPMYGRLTAPARVRVQAGTHDGTWLSMTVHEGRKRQIRNMCAYVGYPVRQLRRTRFGPITLGNLPSGQWRYLSIQEIQVLRQAVGMESPV